MESSAPPGSAPWVFGNQPLPQTLALARVARRLIGTALSLEEEDEGVARLIDELAATERALAGRAPADPTPRIGPDSRPDQRVYLDHGGNIGAFNPCFPEYELRVDGTHASGSVTFPLPYEGPPGYVHGGFLAVFFDGVIQHHNCRYGVAGKTTALNLEYRRPTPLLTTLQFGDPGALRRPAHHLHRPPRARRHRAVPGHHGGGGRGPVPPARRLAATDRRVNAAPAPLPLTLGELWMPGPPTGATIPSSSAMSHTLTYAGAADRSADLARGLLAAGLSHGSRVGLLYPNGPEFVVASLAAARPVRSASPSVPSRRRPNSGGCWTTPGWTPSWPPPPTGASTSSTSSSGGAAPDLDPSAPPPLHFPSVPTLGGWRSTPPTGR